VKLSPDDALHRAITNLRNAYDALCEPQGRIPSLYRQLQTATAANQGAGNHTPRSLPPIWIDAENLLIEIDTAADAWNHQWDRLPITTGRLHTLVETKWQPHQIRSIKQITRILTIWAAQIETLLNPEPAIYLPDPCPNCHATHHRHEDTAGDTVTAPALRLTAARCQCQVCKTAWPPKFLQRLLHT
jgi:hypothetical protein